VSTYPVTFEADYVEERNRVTTFFRLLLAIPHYIVLMFYGLAAFVAVVIAWFALLFTGRWPQGLYDFTAGFLRYTTRVNAYTWLLADPYPPFSGGEEPSYPVRLNIGPPLEEYDRLKVLLRIFYAIPAALIVYVMNIIVELAGIASWIVIVITGKQPKGLQDVIGLGISYMMRANALFFLLTETYPPFNDDHARQIGEPATAAPISSQGPPAAPEVPAQAEPQLAGGFEPPAAPEAPAPPPPPPAAPAPPAAPEPPAAAEPPPPPPPAPEPPAEEDPPPPGPFGPSS
jgi:hypothetical protein